jgi:drug/metabolite transporter (DMT)-like permease
MNTTNQKQNSTKGFLAFLLVAIIFSTSGVVARGMATSFTNYGQVAVRGAVVVLVMMLVLYLKKTKITLKGFAFLPFIVFLVAQPVGNITFAFSANMIKATNSIFYLYVGQLILGFILGRTVLKEKLTHHNWIALGMSGVGLIIFSYPLTSLFSNLGVWLGILCGAAEAVKNAALAKMQEKGKLDTNLIIFYQFLAATVGALIMVWLTKDAFMIALPTWSMAGALILSLFMSIGITSALVFGTKNYDTNLGNIIISTEIAFAAIVNALVLKEFPTTTEVIGGFLLIAALAIIASKPKPEQI